MQKIFEKGTDEYNAFNAVWKFCQKYAIAEDNDAYWDSFIADGESIIKEYPSIKCLPGIIMAISNAKEDEMKKSKKIVNE